MIINPSAGKGRAARVRGEVSQYLKAAGISCVWHETEGSGHAREISASLAPDAIAVALGGDGTVAEVAAGCVGTGRVLGILPAGSGNDYLKALGTGTRLRRALEVLVEGRVRRVDTGESGGDIFVNGLGIGLDAQVAEGVSDAPEYLGGVGGYAWSLARLMAGFGCHKARLTLDGREIHTKTILVSVALGTTCGAIFRLTPHARLDDGLFDVVYSEEVSRAEVLRLIPGVLRGTHLRHPKVHLQRAREVEVEFPAPVPAHADGELLGASKSFLARVVPGNLHVIAP